MCHGRRDSCPPLGARWVRAATRWRTLGTATTPPGWSTRRGRRGRCLGCAWDAVRVPGPDASRPASDPVRHSDCGGSPPRRPGGERSSDIPDRAPGRTRPPATPARTGGRARRRTGRSPLRARRNRARRSVTGAAPRPGPDASRPATARARPAGLTRCASPAHSVGTLPRSSAHAAQHTTHARTRRIATKASDPTEHRSHKGQGCRSARDEATAPVRALAPRVSASGAPLSHRCPETSGSRFRAPDLRRGAAPRCARGASGWCHARTSRRL